MSEKDRRRRCPCGCARFVESKRFNAPKVFFEDACKSRYYLDSAVFTYSLPSKQETGYFRLQSGVVVAQYRVEPHILDTFVLRPGRWRATDGKSGYFGRHQEEAVVILFPELERRMKQVLQEQGWCSFGQHGEYAVYRRLQKAVAR